MKFKAFWGEKEFMASSAEQLRQFVEGYWVGGKFTDEQWNWLVTGKYSYVLDGAPVTVTEQKG